MEPCHGRRSAGRAQPASGERKRRRAEAKAGWLAPGVVVKVKAAGRKARVNAIADDGRADAAFVKGAKEAVRLGPAECETVVPKLGGAVLVVAGPHRGTHATLGAVDMASFSATLEVADGRVLQLGYDEFSKFVAE